MFNSCKLFYAINLVEERLSGFGLTPFSEFQSCINEHSRIGKEFMRAGHGKYFAAAHQITVVAIAYRKLADQLVEKEPWDSMVKDLDRGALAAFGYVRHKEPDAINSISPGATDPQDLADKWREKAEIEGHRLWEKLQTTLSVVIEADKAATRFANTDS